MTFIIFSEFWLKFLLVLKCRGMFPLWTKFILIPLTLLCLAYTAVREFDLSPGHDIFGNNSIASSYQGCFPKLKTNPNDCKKLFYCAASNRSRLIPIIYPVKFSLKGDCKALPKDRQDQQVFEMKVFITGLSQKKLQSGFILRDEENGIYIAQWQGVPTTADVLLPIESFRIYIFLERAADGTILALPTYSTYIKCKVDKGPQSYFFNYCKSQVGIALKRQTNT